MAIKRRKAPVARRKLNPHKMSPAQKKRWKLSGPHPVTSKQIVCDYDPTTGQWDDCHPA
jgi:hypothetical protein